jgi:hypothetical protein
VVDARDESTSWALVFSGPLVETASGAGGGLGWLGGTAPGGLGVGGT